ncbi:MAG: LPS assembly lipoprotein LptE [Gemmatimonadales bacterium]
MNPKLLAAAITAAVASGCLYGFAGGGLPSHIRTIAILPLDNQTAEPALTQESTNAIRDALEGRLGLRVAGEETADAVVRGAVLSYEPDIPLSFRAGAAGNVAVTRRRVQITLRIEIYDRVEDRMLWQRSSLVVDGEYAPPEESRGRELALEKLVNDIVDGAQSQW